MALGFDEECIRLLVRSSTRLTGVEVGRERGKVRGWWIRSKNAGDKESDEKTGLARSAMGVGLTRRGGPLFVGNGRLSIIPLSLPIYHSHGQAYHCANSHIAACGSGVIRNDV